MSLEREKVKRKGFLQIQQSSFTSKRNRLSTNAFQISLIHFAIISDLWRSLCLLDKGNFLRGYDIIITTLMRLVKCHFQDLPRMLTACDKRFWQRRNTPWPRVMAGSRYKSHLWWLPGSISQGPPCHICLPNISSATVICFFFPTSKLWKLTPTWKAMT